MLNVIFFGNTKYSIISAQKIHETIPLTTIVTIPDRLLGRDKTLTPSLVKEFGQSHNIPVITTDKIDTETIEKIKDLKPDFLVVADYGLILPQKLLDIPSTAPLNIHHSLLPKYRGPSPVPFTILSGDKVSGVSVIIMTNKVDAGDIYAQEKYTLQGNETNDSLLTKLNEIGGEIIVPVIQHFETVTPQKQDESKATFTKQFKKDDGYIDISDSIDPIKLDRMIRAYYPWPGVWTLLRLKASEGQAKLKMKNEKVKIVKFLPEKKLQVEGKKPVSMKDFLNGYPELREQFKLLQ